MEKPRGEKKGKTRVSISALPVIKSLSDKDDNLKQAIQDIWLILDELASRNEGHSEMIEGITQYITTIVNEGDEINHYSTETVSGIVPIRIDETEDVDGVTDYEVNLQYQAECIALDLSVDGDGELNADVQYDDDTIKLNPSNELYADGEAIGVDVLVYDPGIATNISNGVGGIKVDVRYDNISIKLDGNKLEVDPTAFLYICEA